MKQLNKISIILTFILTMFISPSVLASILKAEITCHYAGSLMPLKNGSCIGDDDFLSIKINNITKTYNYSDSIGISNNNEGLENCNVYYDRKCIIDLPEHFEIKVWHGPGARTNNGSRVTGGKLILKILLNNKVIWQDETSNAYKMLGLKN